MKWKNTYSDGKLVLTNIKTKREIVCLIDNEDHKKSLDYHWHPVYEGHTGGYYIAASKWSGGRVHNIKLHRLILGLDLPSIQVDHVNHDTLDNRRTNLRPVDHRTNQQNKKRHPSGYPGVTWNKDGHRWVASIKINGVQKYFGSYQAKDAAVNKIWEVGQQYFGEKSPYQKFKEPPRGK